MFIEIPRNATVQQVFVGLSLDKLCTLVTEEWSSRVFSITLKANLLSRISYFLSSILFSLTDCTLLVSNIPVSGCLFSHVTHHLLCQTMIETSFIIDTDLCSRKQFWEATHREKELRTLVNMAWHDLHKKECEREYEREYWREHL